MTTHPHPLAWTHTTRISPVTLLYHQPTHTLAQNKERTDKKHIIIISTLRYLRPTDRHLLDGGRGGRRGTLLRLGAEGKLGEGAWVPSETKRQTGGERVRTRLLVVLVLVLVGGMMVVVVGRIAERTNERTKKKKAMEEWMSKYHCCGCRIYRL
jgi:hypothetical protein